jgi:glucan phosphorylase
MCYIYDAQRIFLNCNTYFLYIPLCRRKWVGGEVLNALAYDVPIPGFNTKNTISLRLWEAKASTEDFNLFLFNDGKYEDAAHFQSKAQQVSKQFTNLFQFVSVNLSRSYVFYVKQ